MPIRVVHLVAKTHLDLGFTALASEVEHQYLTDFFPRALRVAGALRDRGGPEQLTWTTGSWILARALADGDTGRAAAVEAGVRAGVLAWHALPLTFHTELMDVGLFRSGLDIASRLDQRFGRTTTAAKMTDVPGHTRGMVPLLAEAGVTFLHLGVNPAWPVPDVPPVFRWRSPDGAEVTVAYQAGGYGGEVRVDGCEHALAFLHAGDNSGPPSVDDVLAAHADLRARFPDAEVRGSTLDGFARALAASGAVDLLPVVTSEIGDPWIFGAASDPQKLSAFRHLLAERRVRTIWGVERPEWAPPSGDAGQAFDEALLLAAEHTWGLDQKVALPEDRSWDGPSLAALRTTPAGRRFEGSWAEQRAYVDHAAEILAGGPPSPGAAPARIAAAAAEVAATAAGWAAYADLLATDGASPAEPGALLDLGGWTIAIDPATGGASFLRDDRSGRIFADAQHPFGAVVHQSFDEADYERFYTGLTPIPDDEWWARWDNTKPGIDACGARSGWWTPTVRRLVHLTEPHPEAPAHLALPTVLVELAFADDAVALGAPPTVWQRWSADDGSMLELEVLFTDKPATRLPEAMWCSFDPIVAEPDRWELDKLGQRVSPLDVVRHGGRSLHAVGEGMHYDGPDGALTIATWDAPLVAPGTPNLLDADPPLPDLSGGWHVLLHDNCWGTNFPMWNEGPARFAFTLRTR